MNAIYSLVFAALLRPARRHVRWGILIFGRFLQGIGGAMILPATLSTVNTLFQGSDRAIAFAIWGSTIGGMAAVGPFLGGLLTQRTGHRRGAHSTGRWHAHAGGVTPCSRPGLDPRGGVQLGLLLEVLGIGILGMLLTSTLSVWQISPWLFIYGVGVGFATAVATDEPWRVGISSALR